MPRVRGSATTAAPMERDFFPYHPVRLRLGLMAGTIAAVGLGAWAAAAFAQSGSFLDATRAGLAGGLGAAMAITGWRYRPREGWGVRLTPLSVLVSRPRHGLIEVPWGEVRELRRLGEKRDTLALWCSDERRVLVPRHLFATAKTFEALAAALEERLPRRYDA